VRITQEGRRLAAVMSVLQPLRVSRTSTSDEEGRLDATFRIRSIESTIFEILALGPHIEVLEPATLRSQIASLIHEAARHYEGDPDPTSA
jgi:predicted DNA-binding transcriptional regulator YafY